MPGGGTAASHTIKGSAGIFAAQRVVAAALRVETMGREGNLERRRTGLSGIGAGSRTALRRGDAAGRGRRAMTWLQLLRNGRPVVVGFVERLTQLARFGLVAEVVRLRGRRKNAEFSQIRLRR